MVTLSDVAARAGVSVSAVSRVLSDAPGARVSVETRQRIRDAARELDYRPNFAARALKFARTNVVGLVIPDLTNALFTDLMRGLEEEGIRRGFMVLIARTEAMLGDQEALARLIGERRVDGLLVQVGEHLPAEDLQRLTEAQLPIVFINSMSHGQSGSVILEDERGAQIATRHLIDLGHRRIALINGPEAADSAHRRQDGFLRAMTDADLTVPEEYVTRLGYETDQGEIALARIMALPEPPTAVVVANINAAFGALGRARQLGIRIPQDLSLVTIHDAWTAAHTWPPLTSVRMPLYELGRASMTAIVDLIDSGDARDQVVRRPAPELVVRESTAPYTG